MVKRTIGDPIKGSRVWYFLQSIKEPIGSESTLPAHQTEGTTTLGGEDVDEQSKQGRIIQKSTDEHSIELTQYFVPSDPAMEMLEEAQAEGTSIKVWRVPVSESVKEDTGETPTYPAHFGYGRVSELSYADGESLVEVSYTLNIVGKLQKGRFPLSDEDVAIIDEVYGYENPGETTGDYDEVDEGNDEVDEGNDGVDEGNGGVDEGNGGVEG